MSSQLKENPINKWLPFWMGLACAVGLFFGMKIQLPKTKNIEENTAIESRNAIQKLTDAVSYIHAKYDDSLSYQSIVDKALVGLTQGLDPYSSYTEYSEKQAEIDELDGDYEGIGIECRKVNHRFYVSHVYENSPASENGLKVGDEILQVQDIKLDSTVSIKKVISYIKNSEHELKLGIKSQNGIAEKTLVKRQIKISSISYSEDLGNGTIIVGIKNFGDKTYQEFFEVIDQYSKKNKVQKLIIDLRDNSGGFVTAVADILNQLVPEKDQFMFETSGKNTKTRVYKSLGRPFFKFDKIIVLVNENTASASEILAGTLQDLDLAEIIGQNTVGKAMILEQFELSDKSQLRLVTGKYKLPSGRIIQKPFNDAQSEFVETNSAKDKQYFSIKKRRKLDANSGIVPDIILKPEFDIKPDEREEFQRSIEDQILVRFDLIKKLNIKSVGELSTNKSLDSLFLNDCSLNIVCKLNQAFYLKEAKKYCINVLFGEAARRKFELTDDHILQSALHVNK